MAVTLNASTRSRLVAALGNADAATDMTNKIDISTLPPGKFTTIATDTTILAAASTLSGAHHTVYRTTAAGAGGIALTTRTATQMFADIPKCYVGFSYLLTIVSQGGGTVTLTAGTGVTLAGTATVATKVTRTFVCTFTSATALTIQSVSTGAIE